LARWGRDRRGPRCLAPLSEAFALVLAAGLHQFCGELAFCLERAEAALALATEQMLPFWAAFAMTLSGWALVKNGQVEKGLDQLRAGLDAGLATGHRTKEPDWLALFAEASLGTGRIEEALSAVRKGLAETEARYCEAELNRLEGELLLASKEPDQKRAEASFRRAIAVARGQGAKSSELWAATSLAQLLAHRGRRAEARDLLVPVYGWFTEGFDTADLKEAKVLLGQLA
jgi:predicted ATPase